MPGSDRLKLLAHREFGLFWLGMVLSGIGDQFTLIALPWLVLQLTGNPLAVGSVLALSTAPRAGFMLFGGVLTDRVSPVRVIFLSNALRFVMLGILTGIGLAGLTRLWMIYAVVLFLGLCDALYIPARFSIVPRLVPDERLQPANAILMGTSQACMVLGPVIAGFLISALAGREAGPGTTFGTAVAFGVNAAALVLFAACLGLMRIPDLRTHTAGEGGVWTTAVDGLRAAWQDVPVRRLLLIAIPGHLILEGPLTVGLPVFTDAHLDGGPAGFGILMSAFGAGMISGSLGGGWIRQMDPRTLGPQLIGVIAIAGLCAVGIGFTSTLSLGGTCTFLMGLGFGYVDVLIFTWLQRRAPQDQVGRLMGVVMGLMFSTHPVSNAITGALLKIDIRGLFVGAGSLLVVLMIFFAVTPLRHLGEPGRTPGSQGPGPPCRSDGQ